MRAIFYDTETTGLRAEKDFIVEIAAFDPVKNDHFVSFINPGVPIPPETSAIHHITDEMVENAPDFSVVGQQFVDFCGPDALLIAHNNDRFDKLFLNAEFKRNSLVVPSTWRYLDTLMWARRYRPDLPKHGLQVLREHFEIPSNQAHRALDDVIVLHKVFECLIDDLTLQDVVELLDGSKNLTSMPFGKFKGTPLELVPKDYLKWLHGSGALDKEENVELKAAFVEKGLIK